MTELSKKIFDTFQVRKSWKEKTAFIGMMKEYYPDAVVEEKRNFCRNRNIILGDVDKAEVILSAHYDTCAVLPFPNFITPQNMLVYVLYNILICLPMLILMGVGSVCGALISVSLKLDEIWDLILTEAGMLIPALAFIYILIFGVPNRHTANDNTSGVIQLIELYESMTDEMKKKCAFVFFDNEEKGMFGSMAFASMHKNVMADKIVMNFDCVSDGDYIFAVLDKKSERYRSQFEEIFTPQGKKQPVISSAKQTFYPSDQKQFTKSATIALCALNKHRTFGYYMNRIHTDKDVVFDEENIQYFTEKTIEFVERV